VYKNNLFINNVDTSSNPVGPGIGLEVNAGVGNQVLHNVFYGNEIGMFSSYIKAGDIWPLGSASVIVRNNIMYNNTQDYSEHYSAPYGVNVTRDHNLIGVNPHFQNAAAENFRLSASSPAINYGVDTGVYDDIQGYPRPAAGGFDAGAYEYIEWNFDHHVYVPLVVQGN
jgi:hypothetical protein